MSRQRFEACIVSEEISHLTPLIDHITQLISPVLEELGFELVRVRLTGARTKTLQIMAERSDGTMSASDCAKLSRGVSIILEEDDPIEDNYHLEVSSPGIDRPLTREKDFVRWEGFAARLELDRMIEGQKKFKGVLAGIDEGHVAFDIHGEDKTALFPMEWIVQAKLEMTDELIKESLKKATPIDELDDQIEFEEETEEASEGAQKYLH